jgi:hypothetical protein
MFRSTLESPGPSKGFRRPNRYASLDRSVSAIAASSLLGILGFGSSR